MRSLHSVILAGLVVALPGIALAQTTTPPAADTAQPTLSEKLSKTDGVIAPPPSGDVDMTQKPPNVGTMPVIPPQAVTPPGETPGAATPDPK